MADSALESGRVTGVGWTDVDRADASQAYVRYVDAATRSTTYKREALAALALRPGSHVLDVGCGAGDDARALAELVGPAGRVVGVDPSAAMIAEAQRRGTGGGTRAAIDFQVGDIYRLSFPDGAFDVARADRVFQHLADPLAALGELRRVVRPGGLVCVVDTVYESLVLDVANRTLLSRILNHCMDTITSGRIGTQLYGLLHRAGLGDVRVATATFEAITDYAVANQLGDLHVLGERARAAGAITLEEHAEWVETVRALEETGPFFEGFGVIGVVGTVPDSGTSGGSGIG
ncbi:MAG TPA: methyltransferase domain-containing protein [Thermomicrobiaceae bacterium]|nr:methyltransferase domain-containing protein [Thermomicrobiaceae bacterium]